MRIAAVVLTSVLGLSVLAGCGSQESDSAGSSAASRAGKAKVADPKTARMVAAVSNSKTPGDVDLRFALAGRPAVGQPVDLSLAITPLTDLQTLYVKFSPSEGLEISRGAETEHLEHPAVGVVIDHIVSLVAKSDGIFYLTATVLSDSDTESRARNYSIPIIAGAGVPEAPADAESRPESARKSP